MTQLEAIIALLGRSRFSLSNEKALQIEIADALTEAGLPFERECHVHGGIIDFVVSGDVGVEVKIKAPKRQIWRQCSAYLEEARLSSLIIATATAMGVPPSPTGKPVHVVNLGRAWL